MRKCIAAFLFPEREKVYPFREMMNLLIHQSQGHTHAH